MKIRPWVICGALLASSTAAMAATPPHWRNGDLICPDGSAGKPAIMAHYPPTARDLADACAMRASNKALQFYANRPIRTESLQERDRDRANIEKFIGPPK